MIPQITQPLQPASPRQTGALNADFDTFLKMLTAQMRNQDPLNPLDSADFATQLATFTGVEQQIRTNDLLTNLGSQMSVLGMSQLAAWVGQEARAAAPVWMAGAPVTLDLAPATGADRAVLVVRDATGAVVSREEAPLTAGAYQWLGGDALGNPLPQGRYDLRLESFSGDTLLGESEVESYARIIEARNGAGGATLVLEGGIEVPSARITALRVPQG